MFIKSVPPPALLDFINKYETFFVAGHKEPDADCICSQMVLSSLLSRLGKKTVLISAGPFKRNEIKPFENLFLCDSEKIKSEIKIRQAAGSCAVMIVDCSSPDRTGEIEKLYEGIPLAVIDHHAIGRGGGDVRYADSDAPACVTLIFYLSRALNLSLSRKEAELLFLGLCTDTGFFRHLDEGGAEVFEIVGELMRAGASPKATFNVMNGGKSLNSRHLLGVILARSESFFEGKLIISHEELAETEKYGLESRDSDMLYQLLLSIEGVEAVAVIRQESEQNCTVGLRSRDAIDVAAVAAVLGGGGHKNAAGFLKPGKISEIQAILLSEFGTLFH
jgi:phosphoesterase RecJ-like protein